MKSYIDKLKKFRLKFILEQIFNNLFILIFLWAVTFVTYAFTANFLISNFQLLSIISQVYKFLLLLLFLLFLIRTITSLPTLKKIAQLIARLKKYDKEIILSAYELEKANKRFYSSQIQNATIEQANQITENLKYRDVFPPQKTFLHLKIMLFTILFFIVFYFSLNNICKTAVSTLSNVAQFAPKYDSKIKVKPGDATVLRGTDLKISVRNYNPNLKYKLFRKKNLRTKNINLTKDSHTFYNITDTVFYWINNEYASSDTFIINSISKPAVKEMTLEYIYPDYSGIQSKTEKNASGEISALYGTEITVNLHTNNDLAAYRIIFSNGNTEELIKIDKHHYTTKFILKQSCTYHFLLIDYLHHKNQPIERTIFVEDDLSPSIKIVSPAQDKLLAQELTENIHFSSTDDFGLSRISIFFKKNNQNFTERLITDKIAGNIIQDSYTFDVSKIDLIPGDVISYYLKTYDNCNFPESQTGQSKIYLLKFPSIEELYEEIDKEQKTHSENLSKAFKESEKNKRKFDKLRRKYLKQEKFEWEEKEELKQVLKKQKSMAKVAEQTAKEFKKFIQEVKKNKLASRETMEKLQKLQELMKNIASPELKQAMKELHDSMKDMKPEEMKKALDNFQFSQEEFLKKLNNTLELLKKIKQEQAMQKMIQQAKELEKLQKALNKLTKQKLDAQEKLDSLSQEQKNIKDKFSQLKKDMQKQAGELSNNNENKSAEELRKAMSQAEKDKLEENLKKAMQQLQKSQSKVTATQQSISKSLGKMSLSIQKSQQMMQKSVQSKFKKLIRRTAEKLLYFSIAQEKILPASYDSYEILDKEIEIYDGVKNSMNTLMQNPLIMFSINPALMQDVASTYNLFETMFDNLRNNRRYNIQKDKENIFISINKLLSDLLQSHGGSGQGGGGMQQLMQQLKQMSQGQKLSNMMSSALLQKMMQQISNNGKLQPRLSQEARKMMKRIVGNEQRIKNNLERVLNEYPEAKKLLGDLESTKELLEEVVEQLRQGTLDEDLLQKQQHIYSRLLDAQKSIHKRDFSKARRAEVAEEGKYSIPDSLDLPINKIEYRDFLKKLYKNYPDKYHNLIKKYMKQLQKE